MSVAAQSETAKPKTITIRPSHEAAFRRQMKKLGIKSLSEFMNRGALALLSQSERNKLPDLRSQGRPSNENEEA